VSESLVQGYVSHNVLGKARDAFFASRLTRLLCVVYMMLTNNRLNDGYQLE